jgi:hypothetical protein
MPVGLGFTFISAALGALAALLGQKTAAHYIRRSPAIGISSGDRQTDGSRELAHKASGFRAVIAPLVGFFTTVYLFRFVLNLFQYDSYGGPFVIVCSALFVASAVGLAGSTVIWPHRNQNYALLMGIAVPLVICFLAIGTMFGVDIPYGLELPAAVSWAVYYGFPVFGLRFLGLHQVGILAVCGVLGAYAGHWSAARGWRTGSPGKVIRVMSFTNAVGAFALTLGIVLSLFGAGAAAGAIGLVGLLFGLLGSMPTILVARRAGEKTAFKIAEVSLAVSFLAIFLPVLGAILAPRGPRSSNESAAVASLRTINTAQVTYLSSGGGRYGTIQELVDAGLLDGTFKDTRAGYRFEVKLGADDYFAIATPATSKTGKYGYYSTGDAVVRYSTETGLAPRGVSGQPVQ